MKIDNPELLGQMMRERRKNLGFTIQQMAEAVGVSPITIMRLELGRLSYVHERTAKALEVPKKVIKRMVMVAEPVSSDGKILPHSTLAVSPNVKDRELAKATSADKSVKYTSGDIQEIDPVPAFHIAHRNARRAKLEAQERRTSGARQGGPQEPEGDEENERHGRGHTASPLKKFFLWMASHT